MSKNKVYYEIVYVHHVDGIGLCTEIRSFNNVEDCLKFVDGKEIVGYKRMKTEDAEYYLGFENMHDEFTDEDFNDLYPERLGEDTARWMD